MDEKHDVIEKIVVCLKTFEQKHKLFRTYFKNLKDNSISVLSFFHKDFKKDRFSYENLQSFTYTASDPALFISLSQESRIFQALLTSYDSWWASIQDSLTAVSTLTPWMTFLNDDSRVLTVQTLIDQFATQRLFAEDHKHWVRPVLLQHWLIRAERLLSFEKRKFPEWLQLHTELENFDSIAPIENFEILTRFLSEWKFGKWVTDLISARKMQKERIHPEHMAEIERQAKESKVELGQEMETLREMV